MRGEISETWKMDELFDLMGLLKDAGCLEFDLFLFSLIAFYYSSLRMGL